MPVNLQPSSQTSALVLPSTGTHSDVAGALAMVFIVMIQTSLVVQLTK